MSDIPVAVIIPSEQEAVVGSIIKIDGRSSIDPNHLGLTFSWDIIQVPIGSQSQQFGLMFLEDDSSVVSFAPDITGIYKIQLFVSDGITESIPVEAIIDVRAILVPHHQGFVPDANFIWNYLSDFWNLVPDKNRFETIWSSMIQVVSSEMLKLYEYQYNRSIRDIQETIQKRWLSFSPSLDLDRNQVTFIISEETAGVQASTFLIDSTSGLPLTTQPTYSNVISIPSSDGNFTRTSFGLPIAAGRLIHLDGRTFTIGRTGNVFTNTAIFTDLNQVPAALNFLPWRMNSTLISSQYNFDEQGVSIGDLIEIEVLRLDLQIFSTFFIQVTAVDRNRLSFSFNLQDLVDGVAAKGLTEDIQITLATDLIVSGLSAAIDGTLSYSLDAQLIKSTITSNFFKKTYFERVLTAFDEIKVGTFSITARPVRIIRNHKISIDSSFVSIPILQEYIKQPDIIIDGDSTFIVTNDKKIQLPRTPFLLAENLDYIIDDESTITGTCQTQQGNNIIIVPFGDLFDRSISEGDRIEVVQGTTSETFDIRKILTADTLQVFPTPTITSTAALFTIFRKLPGKFIRFIDEIFTKSAPAPLRLWAEVSYLDNNPSIESNFGILVGIKREDLQRVDSGLSYKNAVAGLMYALSRGPTISNLLLASHILIGLPFAQSAGIIREINPSFRIRTDGSPLTGRILVDGVGKDGNRTGITNIYFYPQGRQIFNVALNRWVAAIPELSGLAINPTTNSPYAVGDSVARFSPLAKGVEIHEYISRPDLFDSLIAQGKISFEIQKFHSFRAVINSDLITATDTDLVANFLKKAKAHYVKLISSLLITLEDIIYIDDPLTFIRNIHFFENPDLGTPTAVKIDQRDDDQDFLSLDGIFYTRYQFGFDLVTTQSSTTVSSVSGGFINPRLINNESWDTPLIRPGDLLRIVSGTNIGNYTIVSVLSDTQLSLTLPSTTFQTLTNQEFIVYRPLTSLIWAGKATITLGNSSIPVQESDNSPGGVGSAGVSVGDTLVFADTITLNPSVISRIYKIIEVVPGISPHIVTLSAPVETSGTYSAWIIRNGLLTNGFITPPISSGEQFFINGTINTTIVTFTDSASPSHHNSWLNIALLRPGSRIIIDSVPYEVLQFIPNTKQAILLTPLIATYTNKTVSIDIRPDRPSTYVSTDFLDRIPADFIQLTVVPSSLFADTVHSNSGNPNVSLALTHFDDLGVVPGDYLRFLSGADSTRDVGFGVGIFPIQTVTSTVATLLFNPSATGDFQYSIIRKITHEG